MSITSRTSLTFSAFLTFSLLLLELSKPASCCSQFGLLHFPTNSSWLLGFFCLDRHFSACLCLLPMVYIDTICICGCFFKFVFLEMWGIMSRHFVVYCHQWDFGFVENLQEYFRELSYSYQIFNAMSFVILFFMSIKKYYLFWTTCEFIK